MSRFSQADEAAKMEQLVAELKAIELWADDYWKVAHQNQSAIDSFIAQCLRKTEILSELSTIIYSLTRSRDESCRAWCPDVRNCPRHQTIRPVKNSRLLH